MAITLYLQCILIYFRTIVLVTVFSQYLKNIEIPFPGYSREKGMHITRFPLFRLFPVSSNNELQTLLLTIETSLRRDNVWVGGYFC